MGVASEGRSGVEKSKVRPTSADPAPDIVRTRARGGELVDGSGVRSRPIDHRKRGDGLEELFEAGEVSRDGGPVECELCIVPVVEGQRMEAQLETIG